MIKLDITYFGSTKLDLVIQRQGKKFYLHDQGELGEEISEEDANQIVLCILNNTHNVIAP